MPSRFSSSSLRLPRAAKEGAEAAKHRQEQLEKEAREYVSTMSAMGDRWAAVGNQPLDQLLTSGAAHQRDAMRAGASG
jgi:hypothetical protein